MEWFITQYVQYRQGTTLSVSSEDSIECIYLAKHRRVRLGVFPYTVIPDMSRILLNTNMFVAPSKTPSFRPCHVAGII